MKLIVISGSRNPQGQTARAAEALLAGFTEEGGEGRVFFLPAMDIQSCRQCKNDGWGECTQFGRCVIRDDLDSIVDQIRDADAVLFATPVYFSDLSESLKAFTDRLRRTCLHDDGKKGITGKPTIGVCVAGGGGGGSTRCAFNMDWVFQTTGLDVVDVIPVRRQNLEDKIPVLKETGRALVKRIGG